MTAKTEYDIAVVGGGLAGLATGILMARKGVDVILFEKEQYPFHKVCGEYISMESRDFLMQLGVFADDPDLPLIKELLLTAPGGKMFQTKLPQGGFGISRYKLDSALAAIAKKAGVCLMDRTKVKDVQFSNERHQIIYRNENGDGIVSSKVCCGSFGKRSNLDFKWSRSYLRLTDKKLANYIGVKYHIKTSWPRNVIGLHNFEDGYCGISAIEDGKYCLCYLTRAGNLKKCNNNLKLMEEKVLYQNPWLKKIFTESSFEYMTPVTISQISFHTKTQVEQGILMLGDAAGMITPLCGNGMSIALHCSKIAVDCVADFLQGISSRKEMERFYQLEWKRHFSSRLKRGRWLQKFFGKTWKTNFFISFFRWFPFLAKPVVKMTHGKPF